MNNPLVSVLITSYNREKYIAEAIESVLASTYTNFELIIVDDCSKDRTVEISRNYETMDNRVRVFVNEINIGDYPNRNKAASYARGKYLKYVDSDDKLYSESLAVMVRSMEQYPDAGFGISSRTENEVSYFKPNEAYRIHFFLRGILDTGPTGVIIHTDKFKFCNGFKLIRNVSDFDLWLRMAAKYPVVEMPKNLTFWREHKDQEIKIASNLYDEYNHAIIEENIMSENCPLTIKEKKSIYSKSRRATAKGILKKLIKYQQLNLFIKVFKKYKFNLQDFI